MLNSRAGELEQKLAESQCQTRSIMEELKMARHELRGLQQWRAKAGRLEQLLTEAGVDSRRHGTHIALRRNSSSVVEP